MFILEFIQIFALVYISEVKPYKRLWMNQLEFINEFITLTVINFLFAFSDFTSTSSARVVAGWIILGLFIGQFILNTVVVFSLGLNFLKEKVFKKLIRAKSLRNVIRIRSERMNASLTSLELLKMNITEGKLEKKGI